MNNHIATLVRALVAIEGIQPAQLPAIIDATILAAEAIATDEVKRTAELAKLQVEADGRRKYAANAPAVKPRAHKRRETKPANGDAAA